MMLNIVTERAQFSINTLKSLIEAFGTFINGHIRTEQVP